MQERKGDINLKKVETADYGIWQSELCVSAMTKIFHTEMDVTYLVMTMRSCFTILKNHLKD